jgi:hypothetical protein
MASRAKLQIVHGGFICKPKRLQRHTLVAVKIFIMGGLRCPSATALNWDSPDFLMHGTVETVRLSDYGARRTSCCSSSSPPAPDLKPWLSIGSSKYESLDTQVLGVSVDVPGAFKGGC